MRFNASEMGRLVRCPGSKSLQAAYPDTRDWTATEGVVAATVAEDCLKTGKSPVDFINTSRQNIYIDQDMAHHLTPYVEHCRALKEDINQAGIEVKYTMPHGNNTLVAIPDYWTRRDGTLYVRDLKYGHGWVEVFENYQLLSGALMLIGGETKRVNLGIVQPRANHPDGLIRVWEFDVEEIRPYGNFITGAMERAALAVPPVETGNHCRYCRAFLHCDANRRAKGNALDYAGMASHSRLLPEHFGAEMDLIDRAVTMLTQRKTAMETEGLAMIKAGSVLQGWEARQSMGPMVWGCDAVVMGPLLKVDLRKPPEAITPAQAIARKLLTEKQVKPLAPRAPGAPKLKRTDIAAARRIINGL